MRSEQFLPRAIVCAGLVALSFSVGPTRAQAQQRSTDRWIGVVLPLEAIDVAAETGGRLEKVFVRTGDEVARGTLLAELDAEDTLQNLKIAEAEEQMAQAEFEHALAQTQRESSRYERLLNSADLWSEEELASSGFNAKASAAEARARGAEHEKAHVAVDQLRHALEHLEVRAPFSGHVAVRYLDPGSVVSGGTPIVRLVSGVARLVRFAVPPEEMSQLELGAKVEVLDSQSRPIGRAQVRHISPEIDLAAQRIFAEAILEEGSLSVEPRGGLGVEVRLGQEHLEVESLQ